MKQTTISVKQENKGKRGILDLTGMLSQVLKQFEGIYGRKLPETDGLTVEAWMTAHGVHRFVTKAKNGRMVKKGYTPALINEAWAEGMLLVNNSGKVCGNYIFRNKVAKVVINEGEKDKAYKVFTKAEALKADGKPVSKYMLDLIDPHNWSVKTILDGLIQTRKYDKLVAKAAESQEAWEDLYDEDDLYIVRMNEKGEREIVKVQKDEVYF